MGIFDSLAKQAMGSMLGGKGIDGLTEAAASLLSQSGGLEGLKAKFEQAGLANQFESWTSTGPNQPVDPAQVETAVGPELLQAVGAKLGMDPVKLQGLLSQFLPKIIDQLTPQGKIDNNHPTSNDLQGALGSLMKSFFG